MYRLRMARENVLKTLQVILLGCFCASGLHAQDIHFSQIHASPTFLNPAMVGLIDGNYRVSMNYKQQWLNTTANFQTLAFAADARMTELDGSGYLGIGLNVFADRAGDLNFTKAQAALTLSGARVLDNRGDHIISMAIQAGIINNSIDYSALHVFDDEPLIQSGAPSSASAADVSAGFGWFKGFRKDGLMYLGAAWYHINTPDLAMLGSTANYTEELASKFVFHGGGEALLQRDWYLMPSFIWLEQAPHREINMGSFLRYDYQPYKRDEGGSIYAGLWYRWFFRPDAITRSDAVIVSARLDKDRWAYAFSYDINVSSLVRASQGRGGPELSVIYTGVWDPKSSKRRKVECPKF